MQEIPYLPLVYTFLLASSAPKSLVGSPLFNYHLKAVLKVNDRLEIIAEN